MHIEKETDEKYLDKSEKFEHDRQQMIRASYIRMAPSE